MSTVSTDLSPAGLLQLVKNGLNKGIASSCTAVGCGSILGVEHVIYQSWFLALAGGGATIFGIRCLLILVEASNSLDSSGNASLLPTKGDLREGVTREGMPAVH
jgi:hypothetical protein